MYFNFLFFPNITAHIYYKKYYLHNKKNYELYINNNIQKKYLYNNIIKMFFYIYKDLKKIKKIIILLKYKYIYIHIRLGLYKF
jgi:hypothetical protein